MAHGHYPAKVSKTNIRHDGILSIGNFMLMINNHFTQKNVLPISMATRNFLFIVDLTSWMNGWKDGMCAVLTQMYRIYVAIVFFVLILV
jgi:hypothetical protein